MIERKLYERVLELLRDFRIVYIAGPRQTGKSTLAKVIAGDVGMPKIHFVDTGLACYLL